MKKPRRGVGIWVFFSFFLLAVLAFLLVMITFWSPISHGFETLMATPSFDPTRPVAAIPLETDPPLALRIDTATPALRDTITLNDTLIPTLSVPSITPTFTQTLAPTATLLGGGLSQIAFASTRTGLPQIFIQTTDGQTVRQLTEMTGGACQPDWSPNGLRLVFISPCLNRQDDHSNAKLYVINLDGSGLSLLPGMEGGAFDPAWSPDRTRIAYTSMQDSLSQINTINLNSYLVSALTQKTTDVNAPDWSSQPAWSLDGKNIVFTGHSLLTDTPQIWLMNEFGQDQTRLLNRGTSYWDFLPKWSPDGQTIIFSETSGPQALGWLMVFDYGHIETTAAVHLRSGSYGSNASYSPDGNTLAYESVNTSNPSSTDFHIFLLVNASGNAPTQLPGTVSKSEDFDPAWRPVVSK